MFLNMIDPPVKTNVHLQPVLQGTRFHDQARRLFWTKNTKGLWLASIFLQNIRWKNDDFAKYWSGNCACPYYLQISRQEIVTFNIRVSELCLLSIHSIDPMMDGSLGCWDNGLMGDQWNARFISRVHIMSFISNGDVFYPQGDQKGHSDQRILFRTSSQASVARPSLTRSNSARSR